jgi:hypothetical protein
MQRFTQIAITSASLFLVIAGADARLLAQDKIPQVKQAKKAPEPTFTPAQKQVMKTLSAQSPFVYLTDGRGKYKRISYAYTEVNFAGSCKLHYVEHQYILNEGVGGTDNVHRYTPTNVQLGDLLASEPRVLKSSDLVPPPDGFRYSADAFVIDFPGGNGKPPHRLTFEGEQGARHFLGLLQKAAQSCSTSQ